METIVTVPRCLVRWTVCRIQVRHVCGGDGFRTPHPARMAAEVEEFVKFDHWPAPAWWWWLFQIPGPTPSMLVLEMVEVREKHKAWKASVRDMAVPNLLRGLSKILRR